MVGMTVRWTEEETSEMCYGLVGHLQKPNCYLKEKL